MNFARATELLNYGIPVCRKKDLSHFIFKQVPSNISIDIVPKMQSLPDAVRRVFINRGKDISYSNQLAIVNDDNEISGYSPSVEDVLATDWEVYHV